MNDLADMVRRIVRDELSLARGPRLATVTALTAHEDDSDTANYEADVRFKHDGLEIAKVPIAVPHVGVAAPPRVGDLVLVQFLDHDLQQPFVTGRFYHDQERVPLFKENDVLFEHRVPDGTINHLRFAADGSIFLQRDVKKLDDNSDFTAGIRIDPQGLIELEASKDLKVTMDQQNGKISILCDGKPVEINCDKATVNGNMDVNGDVQVSGKLVVTDGSKKTTVDGNTITGG